MHKPTDKPAGWDGKFTQGQATVVPDKRLQAHGIETEDDRTARIAERECPIAFAATNNVTAPPNYPYNAGFKG